MNTFQVDYDLRAPGRDYESLIKYLKSLPNWCKPLKSAWVVKSTLTASGLRDEILRHIDKNDAVLVVKVGTHEAAWYGLSDEVSNWLKQNL